jgi:hypothetical protein
MAGRNRGPFWNQDAITAAGLAFAGMAVLQSKLLPAASWSEWPLLGRVLVLPVGQLWPVLLFAAGLGLWIGRVYEQHSGRGLKRAVLAGGQSGHRKQNQN